MKDVFRNWSLGKMLFPLAITAILCIPLGQIHDLIEERGAGQRQAAQDDPLRQLVGLAARRLLEPGMPGRAESVHGLTA